MSETHINISSTHSIRKSRQAAHSICETLLTTCRYLRGSVAAQEFLLKTNFQSEILTLESSYASYIVQFLYVSPQGCSQNKVAFNLLKEFYSQQRKFKSTHR